MKSCCLLPSLAVALVLTTPAFCQQQTMARLSRETRADVPHGDSINSGRASAGEASLRDSALSRAAAETLFAKSDLQRANLLSERALRRDHQDAEALFVRMEVAGQEADYATALDAAVQLCEVGALAPADARVRLAAVRVREAAANTPDFRSAISRLQLLLMNSRQPWPDLRAALLKAAMDGAPGLDPYALSRAAGILTDWRIVGPLGSRSLLDFDRQPISPADDLAQNSYANRAVENFQFPDGRIQLPDYFSRSGVFYAAGSFASLTAGEWQLSVQTGGILEVYVDGRQVLRIRNTQKRATANFELRAGPHRVLLKFVGSAMPLRVTVSPGVPMESVPLRAGLSPEEGSYLLAAEHYADGEPAAAIRQIEAVESAASSADLEFLLAQSWSLYAPDSQESARAWYELHSHLPGALAADDALSEQALAKGDLSSAAKYAGDVLAKRGDDLKALEVLTQIPPVSAGLIATEEELWSRRLAARPSCEAFQQAAAFYAANGLLAQKNAVEQKLDGCAPESLNYAQWLSQDGNHAAAARALRALLAGAPLNRAARLMLIPELQLSGDDRAAQHAAAEWLHISPNAEAYHRLAAASSNFAQQDAASRAEFYAPYRRDAAPIARQVAKDESHTAAVVLLDDHVAISRQDGSVSLYIHTARRLFSQPATPQSVFAGIPRGAQVLTLRILRSDGSATALGMAAQAPASSAAALAPGDVLDEEYVLNFAGDGGIPEHAEAFQFVFGSFDEPVLNARFVALTPADRAAGGVVIATGEAPPSTTTVRVGMLERVWEKKTPAQESSRERGSQQGLAIVRVVEQDNGWSVPSNAEHQRRIETIHPGPYPQDS